MRKLLSVAVVAMVAACIPQHAFAQTCTNHAQGLENLARTHKEFPVFQGTSDNGMTIVVTAAESGSYTIIMVRPDGIGCVVDSGEAASVTPVRAPEKAS